MATSAALEARSGAERVADPNLDHALLVYGALIEEADGIPPTLVEYVMWLGLMTTSMGDYWLRQLTEVGAIYTPAILDYGPNYDKASRSRTLTPKGWERYRELIA